MALYEAGRYAEAVEAYRASLAIVDDPITRNNLANALVRAGRAEEAVAEYRRALERHPESGLAWYNYGILLEQVLHDVAHAEQAFQNAIRYAPGMPDAHYRLGRLYLDTARPDAAVEALTRAITLAPPTSPLLGEARKALDVARERIH
jgi:tetratricopeptide (TPR) repeat protein